MNEELNMQEVYSASTWLLNELEQTYVDRLNTICITLYGIWGERNNRFWNNAQTPREIAMNKHFK